MVGECRWATAHTALDEFEGEHILAKLGFLHRATRRPGSEEVISMMGMHLRLLTSHENPSTSERGCGAATWR